MTKETYSVRFIHAISPRPNDFGDNITLSVEAFANHKTLGKALRDAGVLMSGVRVTEWRETDTGFVIFPKLGAGCPWHCIALTHIGRIA